MRTYEKNRVSEWINEVRDCVDWTAAPDRRGTAMQRLASAIAAADDTFAEKLIGILDYPQCVRSSLGNGTPEDRAALAMLPPCR